MFIGALAVVKHGIRRRPRRKPYRKSIIRTVFYSASLREEKAMAKFLGRKTYSVLIVIVVRTSADY